MIYVKLQMLEEYYAVKMIHYKPFDKKFGLKKTYEELFKEGVFVESLPIRPESLNGELYEMRADLETRNLYFEEV